ncbi:MAG: septum formation initiator family protein [Bacteroidales bacterium]|nr:septum formation initiator family protein [Bacteroidales bacterium]
MENYKDTRRSFWRYAAVLTFLALLFLFLKRDNVIRWIQSGAENRRLAKRIEQLEMENQRLADSLRFLSTERDSLEKFARETYHFAEKGDEVFIVK